MTRGVGKHGGARTGAGRPPTSQVNAKYKGLFKRKKKFTHRKTTTSEIRKMQVKRRYALVTLERLQNDNEALRQQRDELCKRLVSGGCARHEEEMKDIDEEPFDYEHCSLSEAQEMVQQQREQKKTLKMLLTRLTQKVVSNAVNVVARKEEVHKKEEPQMQRNYMQQLPPEI
eukprot:CAMPEP_0197029936 /NCGR_PEP_ID=MMETSP1384-20130603/9278_1 /TAXON_ID=29189 /ORGANISM="Ammonia sp." /LENGTH=171 /DNA_ID=CAMNT_0042459195 /DNA_START=28 /DNA_END=543 /DNA_ORIENTATION=-